MKFSPNWNVVKKLMFESLVRRGDFCWHCHTGIFAYPMHVSLMTKVPLIFWGEPGAEYSSFYSYDELEESDERRFNLKINLGINAEDMVGMLDNSVSDYRVTERDLKPFTYPDREMLMENNTLQHLHIGDNITDEGVRYVTEGVQHNDTLTELWLQCCEISVKGNYS